MKVTASTLNGLNVTLEVTPEIELGNFKALCEKAVGFTADEMVVTHEGRLLSDDKKHLKDYEIQEGDQLFIQRIMSMPPSDKVSGTKIDIDAFEAIKVSDVTSNHYEGNLKNPEEDCKDNVDSNLKAAFEQYPESFKKAKLLFINCKVNGHPVQAFVDSGAESTTMSQNCANRCDLKTLIDKRWTALVPCVGDQKVLGRLHHCHIQINDTFLQTSFLILEEQVKDMTIGLDILNRYECCIDLKRNVLIIGTTDTETPLLNKDMASSLNCGISAPLKTA